MSDPISIRSVQVSPQTTSTGERGKPSACIERASEDKKKQKIKPCVSEPFPQGVMSNSFTCGGEGAVPCDFGKENLRIIPISERRGVAKRREDEFQNVSPEDPLVQFVKFFGVHSHSDFLHCLMNRLLTTARSNCSTILNPFISTRQIANNRK